MTASPATATGTTLLIAGDTIHHRDAEGRLCTYAALASQLDLWASQFDRVRFCGVLADGPPPPGFAPYRSTNVRIVPMRKAGGSGPRAKLGILAALANWLRVLVPELRAADAVHLRTPCNVSIIAIVLARLLVPNRYAIYAGSWHAYEGEALSYRLQRGLLRRFFGGVVHAYLPPEEAVDTPNMRIAFSPVLTAEALHERWTTADSARSARTEADHGDLRVVCVGRFSANKNQIVLVEAIRQLQAAGVDVSCRFIGEGEQFDLVATAARGLENVEFVTHATRDEVFATMTWADLNILPSYREGYPKVLLEGICVGALPIGSDTPMNRSMAEGRGWVFDPSRPESLVGVIEEARALQPQGVRERTDSCLAYAKAHTLDAFGVEITHIITSIWGFTDVTKRGNREDEASEGRVEP